MYPVPGHEVYGYVPYWEMDAGIAEHVATTELTTLALFAVTQRPDGGLATNDPGYRRVDGDVGRRLLAEAHVRGTRVEGTGSGRDLLMPRERDLFR